MEISDSFNLNNIKNQIHDKHYKKNLSNLKLSLRNDDIIKSDEYFRKCIKIEDNENIETEYGLFLIKNNRIQMAFQLPLFINRLEKDLSLFIYDYEIYNLLIEDEVNQAMLQVVDNIKNSNIHHYNEFKCNLFYPILKNNEVDWNRTNIEIIKNSFLCNSVIVEFENEINYIFSIFNMIIEKIKTYEEYNLYNQLLEKYEFSDDIEKLFRPLDLLYIDYYETNNINSAIKILNLFTFNITDEFFNEVFDLCHNTNFRNKIDNNVYMYKIYSILNCELEFNEDNSDSIVMEKYSDIKDLLYEHKNEIIKYIDKNIYPIMYYILLVFIDDKNSDYDNIQYFFDNVINNYKDEDGDYTDNLIWLDENDLANIKDKILEKKSQEQANAIIDGTYVNASLDQSIKKLNSLIGLNSVKNELNQIIATEKLNIIRKSRNLNVNTSKSMHLVFTGNPGTGKTTVARMIADIYFSLNLLTTNNCIEVSRTDLVGEYIGQTAIKTKEVIDRANGGVLFIDEAYTLSMSDDKKDFGQEAIDILLKEMEDNRDNLVVIVAGYINEMKRFIETNPGLKSRFNRYINFDDYSADEMIDILINMSNGYDIISNKAKELLKERYVLLSKTKNFANGRQVRNDYEKLKEFRDYRIISQINQDTILDDDFLITINVNDVKKLIEIK